MKDIRIVPVLEIKDGKAIQTASGDPGRYEELKSCVSNSSDPFDVALAYQELGFGEIFILDLDGIADFRPNYDLLAKISRKTGLSVMADIGVWTPEDMLNLDRIEPVISTETFSSLNMLNLPVDFVLSLEIKNGELLSAMNIPLKEFIKIIKDSSKVKQILMVNHGRIASDIGPDIEFCAYVNRELPGRLLMYGSGVRNMLDIKSLYDAGVQKVLVGSALHSGNLLKEMYSGLCKLE